MKIYQSEIDSGLEEAIKANAGIAYSSPVSIYIPSKKQKQDIKDLVLADNKAVSLKTKINSTYTILTLFLFQLVGIRTMMFLTLKKLGLQKKAQFLSNSASCMMSQILLGI